MKNNAKEHKIIKLSEFTNFPSARYAYLDPKGSAESFYDHIKEDFYSNQWVDLFLDSGFNPPSAWIHELLFRLYNTTRALPEKLNIYLGESWIEEDLVVLLRDFTWKCDMSTKVIKMRLGGGF